MNLIWSYLKKYPKWLVYDLFGALLFVVVNLGLPTVLARMIDQAINPKDKQALTFWALVMLAVVISGIVGRVTLAYATGKLSTNMVRDLRRDMYAKLQDYSHEEYEKIGVSSLVTRMTNDAFVLMQFTEMSLRMGVVTPLMMAFSVVMILVTSPSLAWLVALFMPFLIATIAYVAFKTRPLSEHQQKTLDKINQYVRENLTGLRVIRAFARESFQEERFDEKNQTYASISTRLFTLTGLTEPMFIQIIVAMIVAIVWFALEPLNKGSLQIGDLVAFIEYSFHALFSFLIFANLFNMYPAWSFPVDGLMKSWICPCPFLKILTVLLRRKAEVIWNSIMSPLPIQEKRRALFFMTFPSRLDLGKRQPLSARPVQENLLWSVLSLDSTM